MNRLKDAIRNRFSISVAEVGQQEVWQRTALGVACVSPEQQTAHKILDDVAKLLQGAHDIEVTSEEIDVSSW